MTFFQETFYKEGIEWPHATKLDYRCPPGKAFKQADGSSIASITLECNWDTTWTSDPAINVQQLLPCERNNLLKSMTFRQMWNLHSFSCRHTLHRPSLPSRSYQFGSWLGRRACRFQLWHWLQMFEGTKVFERFWSTLSKISVSARKHLDWYIMGTVCWK